jgi:biopolymer transport protein TolQ
MTLPGFLAVFSAGDALHLIGKSTFFGKLVMLTLLVLSLLSWAVMIEKARLLLRIRRGHARFWPVCEAWLEGRLGREEFRRWCQAHPALPLTAMALEIEGAGSISAVRRAAERALYAEVETLERYLMLLSTAVTISPFLGLIGTVWGIMTAFWEMASMRSANLLVVAPGIAEALVTTVAGLSTAIPAVVFYNLFVRKIDLVTNEMERLRTLCEERVAGLAPATAVAAEPRRPDAHEKERIR